METTRNSGEKNLSAILVCYMRLSCELSYLFIKSFYFKKSSLITIHRTQWVMFKITCLVVNLFFFILCLHVSTGPYFSASLVFLSPHDGKVLLCAQRGTQTRLVRKHWNMRKCSSPQEIKCKLCICGCRDTPTATFTANDVTLNTPSNPNLEIHTCNLNWHCWYIP